MNEMKGAFIGYCFRTESSWQDRSFWNKTMLAGWQYDCML